MSRAVEKREYGFETEQIGMVGYSVPPAAFAPIQREW
jgi:hypothetical protein